MPKEQTRDDETQPKEQDEQATQDQDEQPKQPSAEDATDDKKSTEESDDGDLWKGIDEDHPVRKVIKDLRSEAAARRTENKQLHDTLQSLQETVQEFGSPDDIQQAIKEAQEKAEKAERQLIREQVGRTHHLPESLISRLQGETKDEIEADAKKLQADLGIDPEGRKQTYIPKPPPGGGLQHGERSRDTKALVERLSRRNRIG